MRNVFRAKTPCIYSLNYMNDNIFRAIVAQYNYREKEIFMMEGRENTMYKANKAAETLAKEL